MLIIIIIVLLSLYRLNRLCELPRGFGSFPALEILDLTYNNLTNSSFSANFSYLGECLRALYMGDNDLTEFPPQIEKFVHLEIVSCLLLMTALITSAKYLAQLYSYGVQMLLGCLSLVPRLSLSVPLDFTSMNIMHEKVKERESLVQNRTHPWPSQP